MEVAGVTKVSFEPPRPSKYLGYFASSSDYTLDTVTVIASVALGASIIQKQVTLDRDGGGPDDSFSLEPSDLARLCRDAKTSWQALGKPDCERKASEKANVKFRRSLYFVRDLDAGDETDVNDIRSVRPGYALAPKYTAQLIGRRVAKKLARECRF